MHTVGIKGDDICKVLRPAHSKFAALITIITTTIKIMVTSGKGGERGEITIVFFIRT